jgi:hypothetical protein
MGNIESIPAPPINQLASAVDTDIGAVNVTLATGLNKEDDAVTSHAARSNLSVISKTAAVTIGDGAANDTLLDAVTILAALTGTCVITGFTDSDGAAQSITLPAATPAGTKPFYGAINAAGALTFTCSNAADDNLVLVHWRRA